MTRREAETLLTEFFSKFGKNVSAFERGDFVKTNIGEAILGFEFRENERKLVCHALIYKFSKAPRAKVLQTIEREEQNGAATAGGEIVFDQKSLTLALVRFYDKFVDPEVFTDQMQKLAATSLFWSGEVLDRVATNANAE